MNKQCGYLDKSGGFHRSQYECNNANIGYKMTELRQNVEKLTINYSRRFNNRFKEAEHVGGAKRREDIIERIFLELLVNQREILIQYSDAKISLEKEYLELKQKQGLPRLLRKDWWTGSSYEY